MISVDMRLTFPVLVMLDAYDIHIILNHGQHRHEHKEINYSNSAKRTTCNLRDVQSLPDTWNTDHRLHNKNSRIPNTLHFLYARGKESENMDLQSIKI